MLLEVNFKVGAIVDRVDFLAAVALFWANISVADFNGISEDNDLIEFSTLFSGKAFWKEKDLRRC